MNNMFSLGITLIFAGLIVFLNFTGLTNSTPINSASYLMMFYGLTSIVTSFHNMKRSALFLSSVVLNSGIFLYVINNYEVLNKYDLILPFLLFIISSGLLALFLENTREYLFLFTGLIFLALSGITIVYFKAGIVQTAHRITLILFDYLPLFLILFGVILIVSKQRKRSTPTIGSSFNTSE